MTSLPLARVKSPVCEAMILSFGVRLDGVGEALLAVDGRGGAGGALQLGDVHRVARCPVYSSTSHSPAFLPSSTKSEPMKVT